MRWAGAKTADEARGLQCSAGVIFTQLRSNLKEQLEVDLGPCVLVLGPNESWKTAVTESLRLAVLGTRAQHAVGSTAKDLLQLSCAPERGLVCGAYGPDGDALLRVGADGGKVVHSLPAVLSALSVEDRQRTFVADGARALLAPRSPSARAAFVRFFAGDLLKAIPVPRGLTDQQTEFWRRAVAEATRAAGPDADCASILAELASWTMAAQRAATSRAKALEQELGKLKSSVLMTTAAAPERRKDLETQVVLARKWEAGEPARRRIAELTAALENHRADIAAVTARLAADQDTEQSLQTRYDQLTNDAKEAEAAVKDLEQRSSRILGVVAAMETALESDAGCFACGSKGTAAETRRRLKQLQAAAHKREKEIQRAQEAALVVRNDQRGARMDLEKVRALTQDLTNARARHAEASLQCEEEIGRLSVGLPAPYEGPSSANLEARLAEALKAGEATNAEETAARIARGKREEAATWGVLQTEAATMQKEVVSALLDQAATAVQAFLPKDLRVAVALDGKGLAWTLQPYGGPAVVYGAASGRQEGHLLVAACAVLAQGLPWSVVALDDRVLGVFDPPNLRRVVQTLGEMQAAGKVSQVMVTWNRPQELTGIKGFSTLIRRPRVIGV